MNDTAKPATVNGGRRALDRLVTTAFVGIIVAVVLGVGANGLLMWKQTGVFEAQLEALTASVGDLKAEVKELRRAVYQRSAMNRGGP